jgi:hypothetical protein
LDFSGTGPGDNNGGAIMEEAGSPVRVVRNLSLDYFRKKIIGHFDIMFQQHQLVWQVHWSPIHLIKAHNPINNLDVVYSSNNRFKN